MIIFCIFQIISIASTADWAAVFGIAHIKLSLNNQRSSPVRVTSNIGNSRTTMLLQPNTQKTLQDILFRLLINDDVIAREIRIGFHDVDTGKQLLVDAGNGMNLELPLKLVGDNLFVIEREIKFTDQSEFHL